MTVSEFPKRASRVDRRVALIALGLPHHARWEQAEGKLSAVIAGARRAGDDHLAATWSATKEVLKKGLRRTCPGVPQIGRTCNSAISPDAQHCQICNGYIQGAKPKKRKGTKKLHYKRETEAIWNWVLKQRQPWYRETLCFWAREQQPTASHREIWRRVSGVIHRMLKAGLIQGGGPRGCQRFETIRGEPKL